MGTNYIKLDQYDVKIAIIEALSSFARKCSAEAKLAELKMRQMERETDV